MGYDCRLEIASIHAALVLKLDLGLNLGWASVKSASVAQLASASGC